MAVKEYSFKKNGNDDLSPHFKVREFRARIGNALDGDKILIDSELINKLEKLSSAIGYKPIVIVDGYRTEAYDKRLTGRCGQHTKGCAADIFVDGYTSYEIAAIAEVIGFDGIGIISKTSTHLDTRGYKSYFIENSRSAADVTSVRTFICEETLANITKKFFGLADTTINYMKKWNWSDLLFEKLVFRMIKKESA